MYKLNLKLLLIASFLFAFKGFYAQNQTTYTEDSLLYKLSVENNDTNKVGLYIKLCELVWKSDEKQAEGFALEAVSLSKKIGYKLGVAEACRNLGAKYLTAGNLAKAFEYTSISLTEYEELNQTAGLSASLLTLGTINTRQGNYSKAKECFEKALKLNYEIENRNGISSCYRNLGILAANQNNYPNSIEYFEKALAIEQEIGNLIGVSDCLNNIGVIYNYQGNHAISIQYQEEALKVSKEIGDKKSIASRLLNLGASYDDQSEYSKALTCYNEALVLKTELGDSVGISMCYNNIGEVYLDRGDYVHAIEYYEKSLTIDSKLDDKSGMAICLLNIGNVHFQQYNYDKALTYYEKSLAKAETFNGKRIMANVLNCMGEVLLKQGLIVRAIINFDRASILSNEIGDASEIAKSAYYLGVIFLSQGKFNQGLNQLKSALELHEELGEKGKVVADYIKISEAYFLLGDQVKALEFGNLGLNSAIALGLKEDTKNGAEMLSKIYAKSSNFEKAYEYALLFKVMNDSIFTLENQKQIHTIENRFEIERKQREIELQSAKLARQEVEIRQQHFKQNVLLVGFISVLAVVLLFVIAYYRIRKAKQLIQKQKGQIEESNEELNQSNEELNVTIETVNQQKLQIEKTNKEITGSIHYAKYIQNAILPKSETFNKFLKDHFVLYKPKDIVSGDFYWTTELEGRTIIATADCTGHGVPGAFMSMLGVSFLNDIINKEYITHPAVILRRLRKEVIHALQQKGEMGEQRDGMDMGICSIDFKAMELQYSGANCPLYIIRNKNRQGIDNAIKTEFNDTILYEIKGDRMPISIYEKMDKFNLVEVTLQKGDRIYMFSDGFADQFGGVDGKRFKYKPFKQLLLENCEKPMIDQKSELDKAFYSWKQDCDQIDDVMVLGFLV